MKTNYFHQDAADLDDIILAEMLRQERVPSKCLWGGILIQEAAAMGEDPCGLCPCPKREVCGGRAQKADAPPLTADAPLPNLSRITEDEAGARRLVRMNHRRLVMRWAEEAEAEIEDGKAR